MALTLTRGFTFAPNATVTADRLHQLIENATGADIDRTNMANQFYGITASAAEPVGLGVGEVWFDTTELVMKTFDGTIVRSITIQPEVTLFYQANGQGNLESGQTVIVDTAIDEACTKSNTSGDERAIGIAVGGPYTDGSLARVAQSGVIRNARCEAGVVRGDWLANSGATFGNLEGNASRGAGVLGQALTDAFGAPDQVIALMTGNPVGAVPTGSIVMVDSGTSCPSGFTEVVAFQGAYARGAGIGTAPDGSDVAAGDTGGKNVHDALDYTGILPVAADIDGTGIYDGVDLITVNTVTNNAFSIGAIAEDQRIITASPMSGGHQHTLDGVRNEPSFVAVLYCRKT